MIKTINFINESNREFTDSKITLYKALSESAGEQGVILESFSDFFSKVKDIIDKFLAFMKSLFSRFITQLMSMVNSDKYIKKHKDDLRSFGVGDEFDIDGYNFTFSPGIPKVEPMMGFDSDLFKDLYNATPAKERKPGFYKNLYDKKKAIKETCLNILSVIDEL